MKESAFLPAKYPELPGSKQVESAVRKKIGEGEKGPATKEERVDAYLDRIEKIISSGNWVSDERGWELLKRKIVKEFVIDASDPDELAKIARGLYESEKKLAVERGQGAEVERIEQETERRGGVLERYKGLVKEKRDIQERSLSDWLDYLKQNDAQYPTWFRYFTVRNLQKMGILEKEKGEYAKRTPGTVAPFPELNPEALGFVYRMLTEGPGKDEFAGEALSEKKKRLDQFIAKKDFPKLYAFAQIETTGRLNRESVKGQWLKYDQGSDHHPLEKALRGKGTGWCTAEGSAYGHLQGGDFYVYYSKGPDGAMTEPRVAIRMENGQVAEVRGVNPRQELEPELVGVAEGQYRALPGGEKFDKKSHDMKEMTRLVKKQEKGESLDKNDLRFLYELDSKIEGFGYQKDPRIQELRSKRTPMEDAPVVFGCAPSEIAWKPEDITQDTKAYVGPLFPGVFENDNLEHLYTAFPEGRIERFTIEIGGKTAKEYEVELKKDGHRVSELAEDVLRKTPTSKKKQETELARLKVSDLGFTTATRYDEIQKRAKEFGLDLAPAEAGPALRLSMKDQPIGDWVTVGMEAIADRDGDPGVFFVKRHEGGSWLYANYGGPDGRWHPVREFVFRPRKSET